MTTKQMKQLERIKNRRTLYEVVLRMPDGREFLAFYCQKSSRRLFVAAESRYDELVTKTGFTKFSIEKYLESYSAESMPLLKFSGRTQRSAILEGELPFFMEAL